MGVKTVTDQAVPPLRPRLDKTIHERARLMILTYLASGTEEKAGFTELKDALGFSAGNLSIQLKNLEEAGFIGIEKSFRDNKPYTEVFLTETGRSALDVYLDEMERLIGALRR
jgi:DNA-binding HxlR family transcriptional regulator